tara:strand:- start:66 stop:695 length:630 start_codon:yes stop_codon:yes gene_type:complete
MNKFLTFLRAPILDKYNFLRLLFYRVKTKVLYKWLFCGVGSKTTIFKPILLIGVDNISIGNNVLIRDGVRLETHEQGSIVIEDGVSIEQSCNFTSTGNLFIGKDVTISFDVMITNIDHEYQNIGQPILQQPNIIIDTYISENCFIGSGAKIQAGTHLGKQCIVGANSVVRGVFPDYCVIVGAPAKIVKRFNPTTTLWEKVNSDGSFKNE